MESTLVVHHHSPPPLRLHRPNPPNCTARYCLGTTSKLQSSTNGRPHSSPFTRSPSSTSTAESSTSSWSPRISIYCTRRNRTTYRSHSLVGTGYAVLSVGFPSSDLKVETQDEDEVCWLQFGIYIARGPMERDDALELAMADE